MNPHPRICFETRLSRVSLLMHPAPIAHFLSLSTLSVSSSYPSSLLPFTCRPVSLSRILILFSSFWLYLCPFVPCCSAVPPCSPVVGSADFFLGYRPVDRAAIRWTAIRIDYSLPKLRRGAFILYNSPAALVPPSSCSFLCFFVARGYNRASSRARRHPYKLHSCERKTNANARVSRLQDTRYLNNIPQMSRLIFRDGIAHSKRILSDYEEVYSTRRVDENLKENLKEIL